MRRRGSKVLALSILVIASLYAAPQVAVQQLTEMLASARAANRPDEETAQKVARLELKERLTNGTLSALAGEVGDRTWLALKILADRSAFMDLPTAEIIRGGEPNGAEQKAMLARAQAYTVDYVRLLPNLVCTRIVSRFDDIASQHGRYFGGAGGELRLRDTISGELTVRGGAESFELKMVNGAPFEGHLPQAASRRLHTDQRPEQGATSSGEFGSVLATLFVGRTAFKWRHWEVLDGTLSRFNAATPPWNTAR